MLYKARNKKAVSVVIGYVLLIAAGVVMGGIVYAWLKTYVPKDIEECPSDVALTVIRSQCYTTPSGEWYFNLTLQNTGLFDVDGYFIKASNNSQEEIATYDLSKYSELGVDGAILFQYQILEPQDSRKDGFNLTAEKTLLQEIKFIEIIPVRIQENDRGKNDFVACGKSKLKEAINGCSKNSPVWQPGTQNTVYTCTDLDMNNDRLVNTFDTSFVNSCNINYVTGCDKADMTRPKDGDVDVYDVQTFNAQKAALNCPSTLCGNGVIDGTEQCDTNNLNGKTCVTLNQGFTSGTLSCSSTCTYNTALCVLPGDGGTLPGGGGTTGGEGGSI